MRMRKNLPPRYYLSHFFEFLGFFEGANASLLTTDAEKFIRDFKALDSDKQCIIVRAANRKYAVIDRTQFDYQEIDSPQTQIDSLVKLGWFGSLSLADFSDIAGALTKEAILTLLAHYESVQSGASKTKAALIQQLERNVNAYGWPSNVDDSPYLTCLFKVSINYLLFLYFGNTKGRLNQFSMRDLGVMQTRADSVSDVARFDTKEDATLAWFYAKNYDHMAFFSEQARIKLAQQCHPLCQSVVANDYRDKFLYALAISLLPQHRQLAIDLLALAQSDKAKEKWVRESYKEGAREAVRSVLEDIIESPSSDTLLAFAEDFYERKYHKKRTSAVTDMLRNAARKIAIDVSQNQQVEEGVLAHYKRLGIKGWRTENGLWRALFGLTFWTQLYELDTLVTEFDRRPLSLKQNNFYERFHHSIDALLEQLDSVEQYQRHINQMAAQHYGKANGLFVWNESLLEPIHALLTYGNLAPVKTILRMMCEDFASLSDGFPDIMLVDKNTLRFEEIKAPGDKLRRNQLVSIQRLQQAGFHVAVTSVNWHRDPAQPYVVVDLETTGGNSAYHRITEIGMVKVVSGRIVDSYQSLINPQRKIPASITRLTGISDAMVARAPLFSDVADDIATFTEDAVFVAHNVNFDYGFIKQEFLRLGESFQRPKLCTVREMRRVYPGLSSYSLANLTRHFSINMEQHHRALSDANAAAQLLKIILERLECE